MWADPLTSLSALSRQAALPLPPGTTCSMEQNTAWKCLPVCSLSTKVMQDLKSKWQGCFGNKQSCILQPASSFLAPCFSMRLKMKLAIRVRVQMICPPPHTHCAHLFCSLLYSSVLLCLRVIADTFIGLSLTRVLLPRIPADAIPLGRCEGSINMSKMAR